MDDSPDDFASEVDSQQPSSHDHVPRAEMSKRPPGDDWEVGHHHSKSSKSHSAAVAPQQVVIPEDQAAAYSSQRHLLETINSLLNRGTNLIGLGNPAVSSGEFIPQSDSRERTPAVVRDEQSGSCRTTPGVSVQPTPSRDSTPRPYERESSAASTCSSVSMESLLRAARQSNALLGDGVLPPEAVTTRADGKRKQTVAEPSPSGQQVFDFSTINLPPWPNSEARNITGLTPAAAAPPPQFENDDSSTSGPGHSSDELTGLGHILSHFSVGMDHLLSSLKRCQASFHDSLHKQIDAVMCEVKGSMANIPKETVQNDHDSHLSELLGFPPQKRRKAKRRVHFVPSNPGSAPADPSDIQEHTMFMKCIRAHSMILLGITSYKYLCRIKCELTKEEAQAFELDEPGAIKITPTRFMVDCSRSRDSPFNNTASIVFAEDFLDKVNNHSWYSEEKVPLRYRKPHIIIDAFKSHLAYIKLRYRQTVTAPREDPMQAKKDTDARLQKSSRGSRKTRLLKMRLSAMIDDPELSKHVPLIRYLGTQAVSSDESEDEARRTQHYPRVYPQWRSKKLAALMWQADVVAELAVSVPLGTCKKAGGLLRSRPHTDKFNGKAAAPIGLPRNCYDAEWLASLPPHVFKQLRVIDKAYDFGIVDPGSLEPLNHSSDVLASATMSDSIGPNPQITEAVPGPSRQPNPFPTQPPMDVGVPAPTTVPRPVLPNPSQAR